MKTNDKLEQLLEITKRVSSRINVITRRLKLYEEALINIAGFDNTQSANLCAMIAKATLEDAANVTDQIQEEPSRSQDPN